MASELKQVAADLQNSDVICLDLGELVFGVEDGGEVESLASLRLATRRLVSRSFNDGAPIYPCQSACLGLNVWPGRMLLEPATKPHASCRHKRTGRSGPTSRARGIYSALTALERLQIR
jgi:hypothetical protein